MRCMFCDETRGGPCRSIYFSTQPYVRFYCVPCPSDVGPSLWQLIVSFKDIWRGLVVVFYHQETKKRGRLEVNLPGRQEHILRTGRLVTIGQCRTVPLIYLIDLGSGQTWESNKFESKYGERSVKILLNCSNFPRKNMHILRRIVCLLIIPSKK